MDNLRQKIFTLPNKNQVMVSPFQHGKFIFALLLALVSTRHALGQVEATQLLAISATGGQRGSSFELQTIHGNHLVEIDSLVFSDPAIKGQLATSDPRPFSEDRIPKHGHFSVTIPEQVTSGRYEVRAKGRNGLSNPRAFLVTDYPHETPSSIGHEIDKSTPMALNTFLHAKSTAAAIDFYHLELDQPSMLYVEIVAQRLDSRMIPAFKIIDQERHLIGNSRGADGVDVSWNSKEPLQAGKYTLQLNDFIYRGGVEFHYQLVASVQPVPNLMGDIDPKDGQLPDVWSTRAVTQRVQNQNGGLGEEQTTQKQVNAPTVTEPVSLPYVGAHHFGKASKSQIYEFDAQKGQVIAVEVAADRLGQPCDGRILIQRIETQETAATKLHDVTNFDDSQVISDGAMNLFSKDPMGLFTAPEAARYRVSVRDLDRGNTLGSKKWFIVRIGPPEPTFELVAYRPHAHSDLNQSQPTGTRLFRGGTEIIRLIVMRKDGWTGPIKVRCEDLPEGVSAPEITIAANQNVAQIALTASENAIAASSPFRLIGRDKDGTIEKQAYATVVQWGKGNGRDYIQTRQTDTLWVTVSDLDEIPLAVSFGNDTVVDVKKGESIKIPVKLQRKDGGKAAVTARARLFPPGIKAADLTIAAENNEGEIEIKTEAAAATGTYSLWLQVETKIKIKPNPEAVQRAQSYRDHLGSLLEDPSQNSQQDAIKAAASEADKILEAAKNASKDKELTVFLSTNTATLRVIDP